jgi:hypothetical protein
VGKGAIVLANLQYQNGARRQWREAVVQGRAEHFRSAWAFSDINLFGYRKRIV